MNKALSLLANVVHLVITQHRGLDDCRTTQLGNCFSFYERYDPNELNDLNATVTVR